MIKIGPDMMEYAMELERERGIPRDVVVNALKEAMLAAYKRFAKRETIEGVECIIYEKTGEIGLYEVREVVEEIDPEQEHVQLSLKEARRLKPDVEVGDILELEVTPDEFGRIAAQSAKQVITQRIREAEKKLIQQEFEERQGTVATAIVQRIEGRNVIANIGKTEAVLPPREQLPSEYYRVGNKLRVYILDLRDTGRVPQIIVSQAHPAMVREVFELEVPEIEDGIVEIKSIAREAGYRTKVAVTSHDPDVDPQGACIGTRGSRIQAIVNELKNEKIDIIRWSEDPVEFIMNALAPAKILNVVIYEHPRQPRGLVIVPDDQLSLAIGRDGQNVRLAAKLTGFKLDIKSITQLDAEGGYPEPEPYYEPGPQVEGEAAPVAEEGAEPAETAALQEDAEAPESADEQEAEKPKPSADSAEASEVEEASDEAEPSLEEVQQ